MKTNKCRGCACSYNKKEMFWIDDGFPFFDKTEGAIGFCGFCDRNNVFYIENYNEIRKTNKVIDWLRWYILPNLKDLYE